MAVRAVRGAIQVDANERDAILRGRPSWSPRCCGATGSTADDLISIVFTATPDLNADFPAYAARLMGLTDVPLLCATEIAVPGCDAAGAAAAGARRDRTDPRPRSATCTCAARRPCGPTCRSSGRRLAATRRLQTRGFVRPASRARGRPARCRRPAPAEPSRSSSAFDPSTGSWRSTAPRAPASRPLRAGWPSAWAPATWTPARCTAPRPSRCCAPASPSTTRSRSPVRRRRHHRDLHRPRPVRPSARRRPGRRRDPLGRGHRGGERGVRRARGARSAGGPQRELIADGGDRRRGPRHRLGGLADGAPKVYLTASPDARARRRAGELGAEVDVAAVAADIARRDALDSSRAAEPADARRGRGRAGHHRRWTSTRSSTLVELVDLRDEHAEIA